MVVSKRCMTYSLGVRRRGPDGRWAVVGADEAILKCVVKCGLLRRCELGRLRLFLARWRGIVALERRRAEAGAAASDPVAVCARRAARTGTEVNGEANSAHENTPVAFLARAVATSRHAIRPP